MILYITVRLGISFFYLQHSIWSHSFILNLNSFFGNILQESAKCLHARNTPLEGGAYINLFTHYRPAGDPEWYLRDNPEGSPVQILDVGECKLTGRIDQYSQGAVTCDTPAVGPHLSPTMFKANSADDLFQWWKSVGPEFAEVEEEETSSEEDEVGSGDEL